jgi:hypothetical protein
MHFSVNCIIIIIYKNLVFEIVVLILDSVHGMQFAQDQYAQHFGISVDTQMAKIQGTCVFKIEGFKNGGAL